MPARPAELLPWCCPTSASSSRHRRSRPRRRESSRAYANAGPSVIPIAAAPMNSSTSRPRVKVRSKPQRSSNHKVSADEAARPAPLTKLPRQRPLLPQIDPQAAEQHRRPHPEAPPAHAGHGESARQQEQRYAAADAGQRGAEGSAHEYRRKTLNDLISSAPEERSTRFNASTTSLLPSNPSDRMTCRCIHGKPDWNVIQSSRVDPTAHWLESVPQSLHESVQRFG